MFMYVVFVSNGMNNTKIGTSAGYYIAQAMIVIAYIAASLALIWEAW